MFFVIFSVKASFEVTVDDQLIHSKLSTMHFPDFNEVVEIVQGCQKGEKPTQVTKTTSEFGCIIL